MRKIRITVLALALAALCTATALAAGTQAVGDVNGSGDVNMTDMQCLYDLLSTDKYSGSLTDEAGRRAADINGDGTVDILDYQRLYDILRQQVDYDNPVYEYDENGRMIRKCYYDATGKVNRYLVYEYGADGRKSAAVYYNADGSARYNCKIEYRADDWAEWTYYDPETNKVLGVDMDDANGVLRQSIKYDTDTGKAVFAWEFDEKERMVDYKEFSGDTLAFHWSAVYDESGAETRTYYDAATNKVTCIEVFDANETLRKFTEYDTDTGKVVCVKEFDEKERMVDCKGYENGTLPFHWTAVYDEDGIETRTDYDPATNKVTWIEIRDANGTLRKSTEYDTDTGKVVCVREYDENGVVRKYTSYDRETGEILSVGEFDEQGREIGLKKFNNGTLSVHWTAVYDEDGSQTRSDYYKATGNITWAEVRDKLDRTIDCKRYDGGVLSFHWTAVYDENGAEIRTYYNVATDEISSTEKREYDWTNKTCTITQYDVQTDKMYCVQVWEMNGEDDWKLLKETYYDGNGNITSEKEY